VPDALECGNYDSGLWAEVKRSVEEERWQQVASAFGDNTDPLFGAALADDYRELYRCIIELTPAPLKYYLEGAAPTT